MKVALVYDRVNKWGGAERVLLTLHEMFPDAPLYTSVYDSKKAPWADIFDIRTSFLQKLPISFHHEYYPFLMPLAFEGFSFDDYDLVISVTSEAAKGIITKPHTLHICYCLTPTRYLWSGYENYFRNPLFQILSYPSVSYLRAWDLVAAKRPDAYIAISKEVQNRIKKYYDRESEVIYPPVEIPNTKYQIPNTGFFLVVSRLVSYKRIDIAIEACNRLRLPLKIVGVGSEEKRLKRIAGSTIEFLGNLTDNELVRYYKACLALIFPGNEDFGIVMGEASLFSKPVIAFKGGGALEIIREGKTGAFFYPQTAQALTDCLMIFKSKSFKDEIIKDCAVRFGKDRFKKAFFDMIAMLYKEHSKK
ncbi:MAG: glycosyltransferase [Candidatus Levyibacteriota bacterium]|nr:MAG: glycosyltransferase [Candidatus Levybacteria bacterium]